VPGGFRSGDVFLIPLDADRLAVGQVVRGGTLELYVVIYEKIVRSADPVPELKGEKVLFATLTIARKLLDGDWPVVGSQPGNLDDLPMPWFRLEEAGKTYAQSLDRTLVRNVDEATSVRLRDRNLVAPARIEQALRARQPWGKWLAHYDELLADYAFETERAMTSHLAQPMVPAVNHDWPLLDRDRRFVLGTILDFPATVIADLANQPHLAERGIGRWECELPHDALTWTNEVYDIFGLPRGARASRDEAVALYSEHSRAVMEKLRADAIRQTQCFMMDAEIRPGGGEPRWMRLIAAPICENDNVVRLMGLKQYI